MATSSSQMPQGSSDCTTFHKPSTANFVISLLLLLGTVGSYIPQWHRIVARRSSEGISPYFILLGTTSTTCGFINILILSQDVYDCWSDMSWYQEFSATLGIWQVGAQWAAFLLVMLLFLVFFPRASPMTVKGDKLPGQPMYRDALTVVVVCCVHALLSLVISAFIYMFQPQLDIWWAGFLGLQATILTSIQYFPQIWMTYRLKHIGSLSIPMMCIQTPGGFVLAASMYTRLGLGGWSQWMIYLAVAFCQGILLIMAIYYEYIMKRDTSSAIDGYKPIPDAQTEVDSFVDEYRQTGENADLITNRDPES